MSDNKQPTGEVEKSNALESQSAIGSSDPVQSVDAVGSSVETESSKKVGLAEAAKRLLEQKKQAQMIQNGKGTKHGAAGNQSMKSQLTKKPNNQRRRMGV